MDLPRCFSARTRSCRPGLALASLALRIRASRSAKLDLLEDDLGVLEWLAQPSVPSRRSSFLFSPPFDGRPTISGRHGGDDRCSSRSATVERCPPASLLLVGEVIATGELLGADHDAFHAGGHLERVVLDVLAGPPEDGVQQLLFRRQLALALGRDLAHQDVAGAHVGADADDAVLVEVAQHLLADVGDVAGELLAAELGLADLDVELLDVDRGVGVVRRTSRSLMMMASSKLYPSQAHEGDEHVAPQGQLAQGRWRRRRR